MKIALSLILSLFCLSTVSSGDTGSVQPRRVDIRVVLGDRRSDFTLERSKEGEYELSFRSNSGHRTSRALGPLDSKFLLSRLPKSGRGIREGASSGCARSYAILTQIDEPIQPGRKDQLFCLGSDVDEGRAIVPLLETLSLAVATGR